MSNFILSQLRYLLFLLTVAFLGVEVGLRVYFDDPAYWWDFQYVNISPDAFVNQDGFWLYRPDTQIRQIAVYGFPAPGVLPQQDYRVEYDCSFQTNAFGLQDTGTRFDPDKPSVLIVGDSYTEGQGGCPWMHTIAGKFPGLNILNGGLQGTGIQSFYRLFQHLDRSGIQIDKIVMIAIADDFKRTPYIWRPEELACLHDSSNCTARIWWHPLHSADDDQKLQHAARQRAGFRHRELTEADKWHLWLVRHVYTYAFMSRVFGLYFSGQEKRQWQVGVAPTAENVKALQALQTSGKALEVILVPQRDEVALRKSNRDSLQVVGVLNQLGILHSRCELSQDDYLQTDPHPNAQGYAKLAQCLDHRLSTLAIGHSNTDPEDAAR